VHLLRVILLGAPGAGKGTQAKWLAQQLGIAHIASGDIFRQHQQKGTPLGLLAKSYMEKGDLVPDQVTIDMVLERLLESDCKNGYVLDGFPRNSGQASALDNALSQKNESVTASIHIQVSDEELIRRLSGRFICRGCQTPYHSEDFIPKLQGQCDYCSGELYRRDDDNPEAVANRIKVYRKETTPLLEYFQKQGKLDNVDGEQGIDEVNHALINILRPMTPHSQEKRTA
jgi:adenylate kinase